MCHYRSRQRALNSPFDALFYIELSPNFSLWEHNSWKAPSRRNIHSLMVPLLSILYYSLRCTPHRSRFLIVWCSSRPARQPAMRSPLISSNLAVRRTSRDCWKVPVESSYFACPRVNFPALRCVLWFPKLV